MADSYFLILILFSMFPGVRRKKMNKRQRKPALAGQNIHGRSNMELLETPPLRIIEWGGVFYV